VIPGSSGEFGVLPGHSPLISTLKGGVVTVEQGEGARSRIAVLEGVAEVAETHCTVLAEAAQALDNLSSTEAQAQLSAAQEAFESAYNDETRARAQTKLALAEIAAGAV
jgi:F-type H+-transporting ATPase subunit epsilon